MNSSSTISLCVYCGSASGNQSFYRELAADLGRSLVERKVRLVYGGGCIGLMGILADAVLENGGQVLGVIPEFLSSREIMHDGLTDLCIVPDMHTRKAMMASEADAFLALPGGLGTLEELLEILTWSQLQLHQKPVGVLNSRGYFDGTLQQLRRAVDEGFLAANQLSLLLTSADQDELLDALVSRSIQPHSSNPSGKVI